MAMLKLFSARNFKCLANLRPYIERTTFLMNYFQHDSASSKSSRTSNSKFCRYLNGKCKSLIVKIESDKNLSEVKSQLSKSPKLIFGSKKSGDLVGDIFDEQGKIESDGEHEADEKKYPLADGNTELANRYVDFLIRGMKTYLNQNSMWKARLPDFNLQFMNNGLLLVPGYISLKKGYVQDLRTVWRMGDFTMQTYEGYDSLSGFLEIQDLTAVFKNYSSDIFGWKLVGDVEMWAPQNYIYVNVAAVPNIKTGSYLIVNYQLSVGLGKLDINASGLNFISNWLLSKVARMFAKRYMSEISMAMRMAVEDVIQSYLRSNMENTVEVKCF